MSDPIAKAERSKAKDARQMPAPDRAVRRGRKKRPHRPWVLWEKPGRWFGWWKAGKYTDKWLAERAFYLRERKQQHFKTKWEHQVRHESEGKPK